MAMMETEAPASMGDGSSVAMTGGRPSVHRRAERIAVLLPCHNEGKPIASVVQAFRRALPEADIFVYDNNSTDNTVSEAKRAGAKVRSERLQGKGHVVRRMFADIDADIYVIADGDGTYDADAAPVMTALLRDENLDMVVGVRRHIDDSAYRLGHIIGNRLFNWVVKAVFNEQYADMFSGYRVFSRRFVKSFPSLSSGFEIETEISIHTLELKLRFLEVDVGYSSRDDGSESKLRTYRDGSRILLFIFYLLKEIRPLFFFGWIAAILSATGLGLGIIPISDFLQQGTVPHFPTAILSASVMLLACLCIFTGIILDSVSRGRREVKRLLYLMQGTWEQPGLQDIHVAASSSSQ
ncbi:MAG TPA: glycosyltransferase [Stellaceae bacterium]|nr:glycosyltransferase [Stellaceae bacterium]